MNLKNFALIFVSILVIGCGSGNSITTSSNNNVLILTDIHFDPFSSCGESVSKQSQECLLKLINESNPANWKLPINSINTYTEDSNNTFLIQGLQGLNQYIQTYKITKIFILGDLLSHNFRQDFNNYLPQESQAQLTNLALHSLTYVVYNIAKASNHAQIYYVLGNNDTDTEDYLYPSPIFMQQITPNIKNYMADPQAFSTTFSDGGYSQMSLNNQVNVIGLNFNLLTQQNSKIESAVARAEQQLSWLTQQLDTARQQHKKIILLHHEPFGINLYNAATGESPESSDYTVLNPTLEKKYLAIYESYHDIINNYYYGHYHMDSIQVASNLFAFSTLAFNVDFNNNPGFKIINLNQFGELQDYTTYYSNFANQQLSWQQLYDLNSTYDVTPKNYVNFFANNFPSNPNSPQASTYINYYNGLNLIESMLQPISLPNKWINYYCGISEVLLLPYQHCLNTEKY